MKKSTVVFMTLSTMLLAQNTYYYKNHKKEILTPIQTKARSLSPIKYYKNTSGIVLGVSKNLILKVDNAKHLQMYVDKYKLTVLRKLSEGLYLLKSSGHSTTLDIANQLSIEEGVSYAHPDFIKKMHKR